jgi:GxxExxY protein
MHADLGGELTQAVIDVHRELGPCLLESIYAACLADELCRRGIAFLPQVKLPVIDKGSELDCGYVMDVVVADSRRSNRSRRFMKHNC